MSEAGMNWPGTRVLVTGAAGFIGHHLTRRLALLGAHVHAVSRSRRDSEHGETWHVCDLRDVGMTKKLFRAVVPEVVFHLASEVDGARMLPTVHTTLENNLTSTVNILTAAALAPVTRVVLAGSCEEPRPANGHSEPPSPYAMSKWAATGYALLFHNLWRLPVTVLRPAMVYGPGQHDLTKLVPYVVLSLLRRQEPALTSGTKMADWVYVDDVADAFVRAAETGKAVGRVIDVGTGTRTSVRDMVELLFQIVGHPRPPLFGTVPDRPLDIAQAADPALAAELLGWHPTVGLETGLRRTVDWYRAMA